MIVIPQDLEQSFMAMAANERKSPSDLLAQLLAEILEDYYDVKRAEVAIKRIESGEDTLTDWEDVKARLYDVES